MITPSRSKVVVKQRVLDVADVSQRDRHSDQFILYTNHTTKLDHAVLIDFVSTTQTWEPHVLNYIRNYLASTPCLVDKAVLLDPWFVWKHHGWDPVDILIRLVNDRGGPSKVKLCSLTYHLLNLSTSNSTCKYEHWTAYVHLARFL